MITRFLPAAAAALCLTLVGNGAQANTIAHWTFDEGNPGDTASGAGTILDISGNGHVGTPLNGPIYRAIPGGGIGLEFDGVNDRVFVADDAASFNVPSLTVEAVLTLDSLPSGTFALEQIVFRGDSRGGLDPFYLGIRDGLLRFYIETQGLQAVAVESPAALPLNQRIHVAGTIDDATGAMNLYIDGGLVGTKTTAIRPNVTLSGANPGIGIGNLQDSGAQYLDGVIDAVRISNTALAPGEFLTAVPLPGGLLLILSALGSVLGFRLLPRRTR